MLYAVLASLVGWGALLLALRACLARFQPPEWAYRAFTATGATIALAGVIGSVVYIGLHQLLAENSILWTLS
jgi:hypothetical protein